MVKNLAIFSLILLVGFFAKDNIVAAVQSRLTFGKPTFQNFRLSQGNVLFNINLEIMNDTFVPLPLERFDGQVTLDGAPIAQAIINNPLVINPNDSTLIEINVDTPLAKVPLAAYNIIRTGQIPSSLRLKGRGISRGAEIEIDQPLIQIGSITV